MVTPRKLKNTVLRDDAARQVRRWLEDQRKSSGRPNAMFTVSGTVELLYGKPKATEFDSERGLIGYVLRFANSATDRSEAHHYLDFPETIANAAGHASNPMHIVLAKQAGRLPSQSIEAWRAQDLMLETQRRQTLSTFLSTVLDDPDKAVDLFLPEGIEVPWGVWMLPTLQRDRHSATLKGHIFIDNVIAFEMFIIILILDEARGIGRDLRKCNLPGCERFFLVYKPPTGRPQSRYCTKKHMHEAHARTATSRARKSRASKNYGDKR